MPPSSSQGLPIHATHRRNMMKTMPKRTHRVGLLSLTRLMKSALRSFLSFIQIGLLIASMALFLAEDGVVAGGVVEDVGRRVDILVGLEGLDDGAACAMPAHHHLGAEV